MVPRADSPSSVIKRTAALIGHNRTLILDQVSSVNYSEGSEVQGLIEISRHLLLKNRLNTKHHLRKCSY